MNIFTFMQQKVLCCYMTSDWLYDPAVILLDKNKPLPTQNSLK